MVAYNDYEERAEDAFFPIETRLYSCPIGAIVEYGAKADFPEGTVFHGIIKDDAPITQSMTRSVTDHRGAAGGRIYRKTVDSSDSTFTVTLVEYNDVNYSLFTGKTINPVTGAYHLDPSYQGAHRQFFVINEDTTGAVQRLWIPDGQVTETGDRSSVYTAATGFELTISTFSKVVEGERANMLEWFEAATSDAVES
jgi:hypothetical protein